MRNTSLFGIFIIAVFILASCKQSADVASNGWLQKRKYRKGFHFDIAKKKKHEDAYVLSAITPKERHSENISKEVVREQQFFQKPRLTIKNYLSPLKQKSSKAIVLSNSQQETQEASIIADEEEPSDRDKRRKNLKRFWGWLGSFLLLVTSLLLGALIFVDFPLLMVLIGILILPVPLVLSAIYLIEHGALTQGRSNFTEDKKEKHLTWAKRSIKVLVILSVVSIIITLLGILAIVTSQFLLLWAISFIVIGSLYMIAYWSTIVLNILTHSGNFVDTLRVVAILFSPVFVAAATVILAFILGFLSALF